MLGPDRAASAGKRLVGASGHTSRMGHIVLVGLMGSGKTTVGAALATALGVPLRDSDTDIERETGMTGRQHAARDGIDALHALEARHLLEALERPGASVISTAASIVDDAACRAALLDPRHLVVWLDASPAALATRLQPHDHRPAIGPDMAEVLERQAVQRTPALREVADLILDATRPPGELVEAIRTHPDAVR
jgi:shikimate kinase